MSAVMDLPAMDLPAMDLPAMESRAEIVVDLDAIAHNVATLKRRAGVAMMTVVKADGYGHGLVEAAQAARRGGADWLGVAVLEEAMALRRAGDTGPLLSWLTVPDEDVVPAVEAGVDLTAYDVEELATIAAAARGLGTRARVQLKVDTGLSRGGAPAPLWQGLVEAAADAEQSGAVQVSGIWSHFACADEPGHRANDLQERAFARALAVVDTVGLEPEVRHLSNSAGTLLRPWSGYDLVRCGIASYGVSPAPDVVTTAELGLVPAMTVRARLAMVKRIRAGAGVSYGHTWTADRDTTVGLVPVGYGDGVPRSASSRAHVLASGAQRPVAGRVCMDQLVIDLGDDAARAGDEVVLLGTGADGAPTAQDWAEAADTIAYEIVTRIGGRFTRRHVSRAAGGGRVRGGRWLKLGLTGAGAAAAAVTAGVVVERRVDRSREAGAAGADVLGGLRGEVTSVVADDGVVLHAEVDEAAPYGEPDPGQPTIVFVHGYALNLDCWHFQRQFFRGKHRLVFYDQRSHGRSGRSDNEHATIDQLGDDLRQVLEQVVPEGPVVLVGHSMGGMTLMAFAERHPDLFAERVIGAALISTTAGGLKTYQVLSRLIPDRIGVQVGPRVVAALARAPQLVDTVRRRGSNVGFLVARQFAFGGEVPDSYVEFLDNMLAQTSFDVLAQFFPNFDTLDRYRALAAFGRVPTYVVTGTDDQLTSSALSRATAERIPGAVLVECPGAGHMVILEQSDRVDDALEKLVAAALDDSATPVP